MIGTYDLWLVLLSVIVAINASFVALDLASRIEAAQSTAAEWYLIAGGALTMGLGIWSMHFIGMLALRLPIPMSFDVWITLASLLLAVVASAVALFVATRGTLSLTRLLGAGTLMGVGIASMHYVGMAAMRMQPPIEYSGLLFGLSIVVAIAASVATVWSAFVLRMETILTAFWKKAGSAIVMAGG
jgi:NO-binding membrane sensor protein with MHYT domain